MPIDLSLFGAIESDNLHQLNHTLISITGKEAKNFYIHEITAFDHSKRAKSILNSANGLVLVTRGHPEISTLGNYRQVERLELPQVDLESALTSHELTYGFERILKGYEFEFNGVSIRLYQVYRVLERFHVESGELVHPLVIVEALAQDISNDSVPLYSKFIMRIKKHLQNIVELKIVDHLCLVQKLVNSQTS